MHTIQFCLGDWVSGNRNQVNTVSRSGSIGKIVSQVSSIDTHGLSVGQATNIIPIYFLISKTGPSVSSTLDQELFHGSTLGSSEQQLSGIGIVEVNWPGCVLGFLVECSLFKVSRVFSVMSIMIADLICLLSVASPPKIGLNRTTEEATNYVSTCIQNKT